MIHSFIITGRLRESESRIGLSSFFVKAYDKDLLNDDLLGTAFTDDLGFFRIIYQEKDFKEFFENQPDIYLEIYAPDQETFIIDTKASVRQEASDTEDFDLLIDRTSLNTYAPQLSLQLLDEWDEVRTDFDPGESVFIHAKGLIPKTSYDIHVLDNGNGPLFSIRLISNAVGEIPPTALWLQLGLDDPRSGDLFTVEEARNFWGGQAFHVQLMRDGNTILEEEAQFATTFTRTIILNTDDIGNVRNGFEEGEGGALVSIYNLPDYGVINYRVFLVERQHTWFEGDPFRPIRLNNPRESEPLYFRQFSFTGDANYSVNIHDVSSLTAGSYDYILRPVRYGFEEDELHILCNNDLVTRKAPALVVRKNFENHSPVKDSRLNILPTTGRKLQERPYYQFSNAFQPREDIYAALEPEHLPTNVNGRMAAIYTFTHLPNQAWAMSQNLQNLTELGGNPLVQIVKPQIGSLYIPFQLLWPEASTDGVYDVVVDFGDDLTTVNTFSPNHLFDQDKDIINGFFQPGFRVIDDPGVLTEYQFVGSYKYFEDCISVVDVSNGMEVNERIDRKGIVYFPADFSGATSRHQLSAKETRFPLALIVHGNSSFTNSYEGYNYLLEHLARNGFIAVSIHIKPGLRIRARAEMIFKHLEILQRDFGTRLNSNEIALIGHSRGGEATALAAKLAHQVPAYQQYNIKAITAIAPTDNEGQNELRDEWATPFLVLYGSMDGDVVGVPKRFRPANSFMRTGFSLYDRTKDAVKAMGFIYGATHGRFSTVWRDIDLVSSINTIDKPNDIPRIISSQAHEAILKGYILAFLRLHIKSESKWISFIRGEWQAASIHRDGQREVNIFHQFQEVDSLRKTIDTFENNNWELSDIGTVGDGNTLPVDPNEILLSETERSPHITAGLNIKWGNTANFISFNIPETDKNGSDFRTLSIRVSQGFSEVLNTIGVDKTIYISLIDGSGNKRALRNSLFGNIPFPQIRGPIGRYTLEALRTIRIPLAAFNIYISDNLPIDLQDIQAINIEFHSHRLGEIIIDDLELSELNAIS